MKQSVIRVDWQHREHIPDSTAFHPGYGAGLQNTSMYSALRASHWLFTKTDGFSFEHHIFCGGPEGESQVCDE